MTTKTKTKSAEAQRRSDLKKVGILQDREGLANIATAAATIKSAHLFADIDFALGLMMQAAELPAAKKQKLIEAGRAKRLSLLPPSIEDQDTVDLVARLPANLNELPQLAQQLLALGLRSIRKRAASTFAEYQGRSDETAVRRVVEAVGGTVTAIASPPHGPIDSAGVDQHEALDELAPKDLSAVVDETPRKEILVSETNLTIHIGEDGRDGAKTHRDSAEPDHHDHDGPAHAPPDWHPESDAGQPSTA